MDSVLDVLIFVILGSSSLSGSVDQIAQVFLFVHKKCNRMIQSSIALLDLTRNNVVKIPNHMIYHYLHFLKEFQRFKDGSEIPFK